MEKEKSSQDELFQIEQDNPIYKFKIALAIADAFKPIENSKRLYKLEEIDDYLTSIFN